MLSPRITGLAAIVLGIAFNIPYALLAASFEYPDILRQPAAVALGRFAAGGAPLVLTWFGFMLSALALVPLSTALSITPERLSRAPALAIMAALAGALAGLAQAIGLSRWVFAVPALAAAHGDPATDAAGRLAAEQAFALLNSWGGVAIGEHIGQLFTALFVAALAVLQRREGRPITGWMGVATATTLAIGTGEGLALALGQPGDLFSLFTITGFLALTAWLFATGTALLRQR